MMAEKVAEKSDSEKEEEEVERLVRESPKKKPPRHDKERGRVEVEDEDMENDDPDMSMNYKDIGGSVAVAKSVASVYLRSVVAADDEKAFEDFVEKQNEGQGFKNPNENAKKEYVKFDSLPQDRQKQVRQKWKKQRDESGKDKKDKPKKDKPKKDKPKKDKDESEKSEKKKEKSEKQKKKEQKAQTIENMSKPDESELVQNAIGSDDPDVQRAALDEIKSRKGPFPKDFPEPSSGGLPPGAREDMRKHVENWDQLDYQLNMARIQQEKLDADLQDNGAAKKFYEEAQEAYKEIADKEIEQGGLVEHNSPESLFKDEKGLSKPMTEEDEAALKDKTRKWHQMAMFSPLNKVGELADQIEKRLENVKKAPDKKKHLEPEKDPNAEYHHTKEDKEKSRAVVEGSKEHEYLKAMQKSFKKVRDSKMFSKGSSSSDFLLSMRESEDVGLDPGDYDMTNPSDQGAFVQQMGELPDEQLAALVKENPSYRAYLGLGDDYDPENVSISDEDRKEFMDAVGRDLAVRGWYEQVQNAAGDDSVMSEASRLAYRDEVMESFGGKGKTNKEKLQGFWDTFLNWMEDMSYEELHGEKAIKKSRTASAYRGGVRKALDRSNVKTAQYRGTKDLQRDYRDWRLPKSTQDLEMEDYMEIVRVAREWLDDSFLKHVSVDWNYEMACELALDYSIYTASDHKYNGAVGMPAYAKLLTILKRLHKPS